MHVPLVTSLTPGELVYRKDGFEHHFAVGDGLVEITQDHVSILTDLAAIDTDIDEGEVEAALQRARDMAAQQTQDSTPEEIASVQAAIQKAMAQLKVKRRRHSL
jgi:F0F1-type ATP synthase epsilon subunit